MMNWALSPFLKAQTFTVSPFFLSPLPIFQQHHMSHFCLFGLYAVAQFDLSSKSDLMLFTLTLLLNFAVL